MSLQAIENSPLASKPLTLSQKLLALLPLSFFLFRLWVTYQEGQPQIVFWLCHLNNLLLCFGICFSSPKIIQITSLWLFVGFGMWVVDLFDTGIFTISSFLSHLGGLSISCYFLIKTKMSLYVWVYSIIWFLLVQQFTRMFTPEHLNINSAFAIWGNYKKIFDHYWAFWVFQVIAITIILWVTNLIMYFILKKIQEKRPTCI